MFENVRVVLVEPSHPGNIGGACRALKTMGLSRLYVVNPERFPDPQAQWRAAGAQDVLDALVLCGSLREAIDDCRLVIGTSTRSRRIPWPAADARATAERVLSQPRDAEVAIVFGRETNGLSNDELKLCHQHLQIPANPDYPSLNLAMAVQVVTYELFQAQAQAFEEPDWDRPLASIAATEGMLDQLDALLRDIGFLDPKQEGQSMTRLRRLLLRIQMDDTEVQMLRGILSELRHRLGSAA